MTVKTVYPHTISQSSGSNIQSFNNLSNLKNSNATYAKTGQIASKSGTRKKPATITAKNFKANIPAGSKINSVTVEYAADYEGNITIGKPTINILKITGDNKNGKALTKTLTKTSVTWTGDHTIANMNSSDFGVSISFPANTKADVGYVKLKYIRIIIDYTAPNFNVSGNHVSGTYKNEEHLVKLTLSNVNKTKQGSNVNIQFPANLGFIYKDSGDGWVAVNPAPMGSPVSLIWNTGIGSKSSVSIVLRVYPTTSGNHNISWSETGSGHNGSFSFNASEPAHIEHPEIPMNTPEPQTITDDEATPTEKPIPTNIVQVGINEEFNSDLTFDDYNGDKVRLYTYTHDYTFDLENAERTDKIQMYRSAIGALTPGWYPVNTYDNYNQMWSTPAAQSFENGVFENLFRIINQGYYTILIYSEDNETLLKKILISVKPNTISIPSLSIVRLEGEEINRLGENIGYTVQSFMKLVTSEPFARDWNNTFKLGVFNNSIEENIESLATFGDFEDGEVTATLNLPEDAVSYDIQSDYEITTVETEDTITFSEFDENKNVTVIINFLDSEENIVSTGEYFINFDDEDILIIENDYDPTDYETLTNIQIYQNAAYWCNILDVVNEWKSVVCDFVYNPNYPLYVIITGDTAEGNPLYNNIQFTEPCIIESDVYNGQENNGNYPRPILSMVNDAEEPSNIQLSSFEESTHVIVYNPSLPEKYGTDESIAIRGIEINADIDYTDDLILFAKLKIRQDNEYIVGNRSIVINSTDDNLKIGGNYDTWGLNISELVNLDQMELELGVNNIIEETDANILLKNLQLTIYSNEINYQPLGILVEDENVAWYGMDITDIEIPFGRNSETKYLNIEGTDTNVAYRQNIRGKEIKIHFSLDGCDLNETTAQVQQLAKLFTNKRDELNAPIPKEIRFTHIPDKFFYYILEDTFDTDINISDYKGSITLFIPDGTAFDIKDTVTNVNGYVEGIASVNPIIALTHITNNQLTVSELVNNPNQVFKINKDNLSDTNITFGVNDTIVINCITRECVLIKSDETETIDITEAVDFNSDWFKIQGEFEFKSENCVIQTVTYNTRS